MENELLRLWEESVGIEWQNYTRKGSYDSQANFLSKDFSPLSLFSDPRRHKYSWAIPTPEALALIAGHSPIVEIGAGAGYWAALLRDSGATVYAYDENPPNGGEENHWAQNATQWTPVEKGTPAKVALHPEATLFLCWPPMTKMAFKCLLDYDGERVIYVGEDWGGCNADVSFFKELSQAWVRKVELEIPQWFGLNDSLVMYERSPVT